jgi:hypothetical protein
LYAIFLRDNFITVLTTLIDYYGFPKDGPGMAQRPEGSPRKRVEYVEQSISAAVGDSRFLPHLALHEIEAWVLAACSRLGEFMGTASLPLNFNGSWTERAARNRSTTAKIRRHRNAS